MYLSVTDPAGERTQRCIGPTPFASARHTTVSLPTALRPYDNEDEKEDDDATFPTALTYPYTLRGASVAYGDERVRRPRDRTETEWAGEGGDLAPALRDLCVIPDARWQHPPPLADVPIAPDGKGLLPRDTLHPRISEMQAQENAKAVFYAPHVGLLANASRKKPPCPSYGALPPGGSAPLEQTVMEEAPEGMVASAARASKRGDVRTRIGRAYYAGGAFHDAEHYASSVVQFATTQPRSLTSIAAKALASALHDGPQKSVVALALKKGNEANMDDAPLLPPPPAFRNLHPDLQRLLLRRDRDCRHRVEQWLVAKHPPLQPPADADDHAAVMEPPPPPQRRVPVIIDTEECDDAVDDGDDDVMPRGMLGMWVRAVRQLMPSEDETLFASRRLKILSPGVLQSFVTSHPGVVAVSSWVTGRGVRDGSSMKSIRTVERSAFAPARAPVPSPLSPTSLALGRPQQERTTSPPGKLVGGVATPLGGVGFSNESFAALLAERGDEVEFSHLDGCSSLTAASLSLIGKRCRRLRLLDVSRCNVTDDILSVLSQQCSQLSFLNISYCDVSATALHSFLKSASQLVALFLSGVTSVGESPELWEALRHTPKLSIVDVSYCGVTDDALIALAKHCKCLERLDITGCDAITSIGVRAISDRCRSLCDFRAAFCFGVEEDGWKSLVALAPGLIHLDVSGNGPSLTPSALCAVLSTLSSLQTLSLAGCPGVDDDVLSSIPAGCAHLSRLDATACGRVSLAGCMAVLDAVPRLRVLRVTETTLSQHQAEILRQQRERCRIVRQPYNVPRAPPRIAYKSAAPPTKTKGRGK